MHAKPTKEFCQLLADAVPLETQILNLSSLTFLLEQFTTVAIEMRCDELGSGRMTYVDCTS